MVEFFPPSQKNKRNATGKFQMVELGFIGGKIHRKDDNDPYLIKIGGSPVSVHVIYFFIYFIFLIKKWY